MVFDLSPHSGLSLEAFEPSRDVCHAERRAIVAQ